MFYGDQDLLEKEFIKTVTKYHNKYLVARLIEYIDQRIIDNLIQEVKKENNTDMLRTLKNNKFP